MSAARRPASPLPCVHLNWNTPWDSVVVGFSWPQTHDTPFSSSPISPGPSKRAHFFVEYFSLSSSGSSFPGLPPRHMGFTAFMALCPPHLKRGSRPAAPPERELRDASGHTSRLCAAPASSCVSDLNQFSKRNTCLSSEGRQNPGEAGSGAGIIKCIFQNACCFQGSKA